MSIGDVLLDTAKLLQYSEVVTAELLAALRAYTRTIQACSQVSTAKSELLVKLVLNSPSQNMQQAAAEVIRNLMRILEHERYLKQLGG